MSKNHFLYRRLEEISTLQSKDIPDRIANIEQRITNAMAYHKALKPMFKADDYSYFKVWMDVITELKKAWV